MTHFIVILSLLRWSGIKPAISLKCACTVNVAAEHELNPARATSSSTSSHFSISTKGFPCSVDLILRLANWGAAFN